jgi:hypothetical protein
MPALDLNEINFLAVLVAAIAAFLIGGAWYSALFRKPWIASRGYSDEQIKQMQKRHPPAAFFSIMFICYLVVALVMAAMMSIFGIRGGAHGALLGVLIWIIAAAIAMTGHITSTVRLSGYFIDVSYQLVYLVLIGWIIGAWR